MATEQARHQTKPGAVAVRVMGGMLLVVGLRWLIGLIGLVVPGMEQLPSLFRLRDQVQVLGVFLVRGWPALVLLSVTGAAFMFAGVQVMRLRRSGWIAGLAVLGYASLSLFLWIGTDQAQRAVDAFCASQDMDPMMVRIFSGRHAFGVAKVCRIAWFFLLCYFAALLYLASEWRRFLGSGRTAGSFGKRSDRTQGWRPSRWSEYGKVAAAVLVVGVSGLWAFWGAEYARYWRLLRVARTSSLEADDTSVLRRTMIERLRGRTGRTEPTFEPAAIESLPLAHERRIEAVLVRRLASERTDALAAAANASSCDISFLCAEDVPSIVAAARDGSVRVRHACYELLGRIGTNEAEACLRDAVNGERDDAWIAALGAFARLRPGQAPAALMRMARGNSRDRDCLIRDFGHFRDPRVLPILLDAVRDQDPQVRRSAIWALENHPGPAAERALQQALKDDRIWIRGAACWALARIGTPAAIPALIEVLRGREDAYKRPNQPEPESLHGVAAYALSRTSGEDFGHDVEKWERWWQAAGTELDLRKDLVRRLFTPLPRPPIRAPRTIQEAQEHPHTQAASVQRGAIRSVRQRDIRSLGPALARYIGLPDEQAPWKFVVAGLLADWGYGEGIEWLIEWVDSDLSPGNRMFAISALGRACGVNFFSDKKRWRAWWKGNRHRFPSADTPRGSQDAHP